MKIQTFLSQSPLFALYQAQYAILEPLQDRLSKHGVHLLQGLILTAMFFEERDVRPRDLHSAFGVERSNLSHSLRGLEKKGFIKRSTHPTDARGYIFSLTSSGRKKALTLIQEFDRTQDRFESVFGVKKSRELVESIQSLVIEFEN